MKKTMISVLGAFALILSTAAMAGGPEMAPVPAQTTPHGLYVTAGLGYGLTQVTQSKDLLPSITRDGLNWNAAVGYRFGQYVAVEGGYIGMATVKTPLLGGGSFRTHRGAAYAAVKGIYPINNQFDVFGEAGLGLSFTSGRALTGVISTSTTHKVLPLFAIGGDYNINQHVAVTVKGIATLKNGPFPATYGATLGLTYSFLG